MSCRCHTRKVLDRRDNMCASHQQQQLLGGCGSPGAEGNWSIHTYIHAFVTREGQNHSRVCATKNAKTIDFLSACRKGGGGGNNEKHSDDVPMQRGGC